MATVKASSIYESVISIAIISITITVATYIFVNIMSSQETISYYQMIEKVAELKEECEVKQSFTNKNINFKEFNISQNITNYKGNEKLKLVKFTISKNKKKIKIIEYLIQKNEF